MRSAANTPTRLRGPRISMGMSAGSLTSPDVGAVGDPSRTPVVPSRPRRQQPAPTQRVGMTTPHTGLPAVTQPVCLRENTSTGVHRGPLARDGQGGKPGSSPSAVQQASAPNRRRRCHRGPTSEIRRPQAWCLLERVADPRRSRGRGCGPRHRAASTRPPLHRRRRVGRDRHLDEPEASRPNLYL